MSEATFSWWWVPYKKLYHFDRYDERILQSDQTSCTTVHIQTKVVASNTNFFWWLSSCSKPKISIDSCQRYYDQTILQSD